MEQEKANEQKITYNQRLKQWARQLKSDVIAIYFALQHPQTPLHAKIFAAVVVGYALSPIDLIPDFVPILGYLDDVILLPMGIALVIRLIPNNVLDACREQAKKHPPTTKPRVWVAAYVIAMVWLVILYNLYSWLK